MIGGRDAPRPAEDDLIPGAAVENVRHLRPVALETTVRLAEAVLVPPAFFVPAAAPEEQHVGIEPRGRGLRRVGKRGALCGGRAC